MARNQQFKYGEDMGYVDIHGRDIRVLVCEKTGSILVPIDELKNMGFSIYRKSQYNKLLIDDSQFTNEFNLYMLECAQTYMLKHKIAFKEIEILESINKCKKLLAESHSAEPNKPTSSPQFLKNHTIQSSPNADINITTVTTLREPSALTRQNLNLMNERKVNTNISPASSGNLFDASNNLEPDHFKKPQFENRNPRNSRSFEQNSNSDNQKKQNNSFEYKNQKGGRPFDQNSMTSNNSDENRRQSRSFEQKNLRRPESFKQNGNIRSNNLIKSPDKPKRDNGDLQDDDMKKILSIELSKPEHKVLVSHIDKPNALWVQDVDNADVLIKIDKQIKDEVLKQKVVTRCEFNNIYLGKDEGEWYRCKPIKFKPLTVFFIDYGNTAQVTERDLREVSEELASIPAQSVRVTFDDAEKHKIEAFQIITIRIVRRYDKGTYKVEIVSEDTAKENIPPTVTPAQPAAVAKKTTHTYFDRPKPLCTLQNGQRVMIINEIDGKLVLRTKECYDKLKQVEQLIEEITAEPLPDKPKKGQLVLCNHNDKLHRGQIVSVVGDSVEIKLLDYGDKISVTASSLKNITESLSVEPVTYIISPSINGGKELSPKAEEMLQNMVKNRVKATVVLNSGEFDLQQADGLLSEKLQGLESVSDGIMLKDLKWYKPALGQGSYMLYSFKDSDNITFVAENELLENIEDIIISELEDDNAHSPVVGEVCYGLFQDNWSRCVVIREMKGRFEVKFLDFGNLEFLRSEQLRKATEQIKNTPILGVQGRFVGLPPVKNYEQLLREYIIDGEAYILDVKKVDAKTDICEIEAPKLYQKLKECH